MTIPTAVIAAHRSGKALRVQKLDGEIVVLLVLGTDERELQYAVHTSTHPERYGVCDSTGFIMNYNEIEDAEVLEAPPPRLRAILSE